MLIGALAVKPLDQQHILARGADKEDRRSIDAAQRGKTHGDKPALDYVVDVAEEENFATCLTAPSWISACPPP
ncbi:MAG TPA: hypothetical protein VFY39_12925 [Gammaproteobacteria bacterium]|nr:hypothetical protein [Gammaproteobacteria bacterium]